jgi:hypothetical protein
VEWLEVLGPEFKPQSAKKKKKKKRKKEREETLPYVELPLRKYIPSVD